MRGRWFVFGFLAGALTSFVVYYSALRTARVQAKSIRTEEPVVAKNASDGISPPIAGLKRSDLRDSFNEFHFGHRHEALDIMEPRGTPVLAVTDGTIAKLLASKAGGNTIYEFDNPQTYCYYYAHLDRYADNLKEGARISRGQVIGYVGSTGDASPNAPHLHFGMTLAGPEHKWSGGTPVDPYPVLLQVIR
ncbi:MAG TPA: M23 family metallopeptidase [Bryobacteraceae bacterium]|nr:M23 family metallopeptidase [Bryobacteraceae bacterium]